MTMKNILSVTCLMATLILLSSCNRIQPVLLLTPGDILTWIAIIIGLSLVASLYMNGGKTEKMFWFWFVVGCLFIPILIVAVIVKFIFRKKE